MKCLIVIVCSYFFCVNVQAQAGIRDSLDVTTIDFVSDTQQPLGVEKIYMKQTQNTRATAMIYDAIVHEKPAALFMLGDIVALGYSNKKWIKTDRFLERARQGGTKVFGLLGNHDVMLRNGPGERNFGKRFPEHRRTGYLEVIDSIAVVLLNSNFSKLAIEEIDQQQHWYVKALDSLDKHPGVKAIIVTCHHPVFTNSNMAKPSLGVRLQFLPAFLATKKCVLFVTGHAHAFEHFKYKQKDFLIIGGGGGLHQPLTIKGDMPPDLAAAYKPLFHYLQLRRYGNFLQLRSYMITPDFSGFAAGYTIVVNTQQQ